MLGGHTSRKNKKRLDWVSKKKKLGKGKENDTPDRGGGSVKCGRWQSYCISPNGNE